MTRHFQVIIEKELSGGYSAHVPILEGCASQGESVDECLANIRVAISLYLESLAEDGIPIPTCEPEVILRDVEVTV